MLDMFHSKEHLIRSSDPSLWGFAGLDFSDNDSQKLSNRIWNAVNSKLLNIIIVLLVLIDSLVIICQLIIDSNWITDPSWRALTNCTNITTNATTYDNNSSQISPTLLIAKNVFTYTSLTIISFFFVEILLRIYSGKLKLFVQPLELLDALLVNVLFVLSIVFFLHDSRDKNGGQKSTLLIVLLRLWRVFKIVRTLIEESEQKLIQVLNICEKEKTHAEHKNDILILKVEDLEHEVAYLKEKLKKTEKENSAFIQQLMDGKSKKNAKRTQSSQSTSSYCPCRKDSLKDSLRDSLKSSLKGSLKDSLRDSPKGKIQSHNHLKNEKCSANNYTSVNIEREPKTLKSSPIKMNEAIDLDYFARNLAQSITIDVMSAVIGKNECNSKSGNETVMNGIRPVSNKTSPSSHNHINSLIMPSPHNQSRIYSSLFLISDQSNHSQQSRMASNVNSCVAAYQLNEELEIERIKKVEFKCNDVDIPLSSL